MADNIEITAGSGTPVRTDEGSDGKHYQIVKLADGTADSTAVIPGSTADGLLVNLGTNNDVTVTGTVTANAGTNLNTSALALETGGNLASAVTALQLIDDTVFADDAAFTIGTSKIAAVGGIAVAHGSAPDAADAADAGVFLMNRHRVQWVIGGHPNVVTLEAEYTSAQTDTAFVTISTGSKIVVTQAQVVCSNATTATPSFRLGFGTANTPTTTGVVLTHGGVAGGGGVSRGDGSGIIGVGADNEDLRFTCTVPTGGGLRVLVTYYTIET